MVQQRRICVRAKITCSKFILPNYRLINHGLQTLVFNPGIKRVLTNIESSSESVSIKKGQIAKQNGRMDFMFVWIDYSRNPNST